MPITCHQDFAFFCDESGISTDRFTVVGGISMRRDSINRILADMEAFRDRFTMTKELKWTKITDAKIEEYKHLVDYFFALNKADQCQFHCIVSIAINGSMENITMATGMLVFRSFIIRCFIISSANCAVRMGAFSCASTGATAAQASKTSAAC